MEDSTLYETTVELNARISNQYKKTWAAAQQATEKWTDGIRETQDIAARTQSISDLARRIQEFNRIQEQSPTDARANDIAYLTHEYERLRGGIQASSEEFARITKLADAANRALDQQTISAKSVGELNKALGDVKGILKMEKEVERLSKLYDEMPSDELKRDLEMQKKALERMRAAANLAGTGVVELTRHQKELEKALKRAQGLEKIHKQLGKLQTASKTALKVAAAGVASFVAAATASAAALAKVADDTATNLVELQSRSEQFGISTQKLQGWQKVFEFDGIETDQVNDAFQELQIKISEATKEAGDMRDQFAKIGIDKEFLENNDAAAVMERIGENIHMLKNESDITEWGDTVFGGEGARMLSILAKQSPKVRAQMIEDLKKTGQIASDEAVASAKAYDEAKKKMKGAFQGVVQMVAEKVMPIMTQLFERLSKWVAENQETIKGWADKITGWMEKIPGLINGAFGILEKVPGWIEAIANFFEDWKDVIPILVAIAGALTFFSFILPIINGLLMANPVVLIIMAIIAAIVILVALIYTFKDEIVAAFKAAVEWASNAWKSIVEFFKGLGESIASTFSSMWETVSGFFSSIVDFASEKIAAIGEFFASIPENIGMALESAKELLKSGINWVIKKVNAISFTVPDWIPEIGGKTMGFNIPLLASGGIVTKPTLSMVGEGAEPEAVLPLSKLKSFLGGDSVNSSVSVNVTQNISINGQNGLSKADVKDAASTGGLDLAREIERILAQKQRLAM